jgi:hypothetical protein
MLLMYKINGLRLATVFSIALFTACSSPAKKQHEDNLQKVNGMQNRSSEATEDPANNINSGKMTDSTDTDTTGKQP